jgi:hypothetical protein
MTLVNFLPPIFDNGELLVDGGYVNDLSLLALLLSLLALLLSLLALLKKKNTNTHVRACRYVNNLPADVMASMGVP